jgi:hypothetical protein
VGTLVGEVIASDDFKQYHWLIFPIGFAMGFVSAFAEPALHILSNQVDSVTKHSISKKVLIFTISIGVGLSITLSMLRLVLGFHALWLLVPGYVLIFILSKFVNPTFAAVAFDAGGVVIGPMCVSFILSFTLGVSDAFGEEMNGFGMVGMVAMSPILAVMLLGCFYNFRQKLRDKKAGTA